jgi:hypothetical protein
MISGFFQTARRTDGHAIFGMAVSKIENAGIVAEAHRIARERGRNVVAIIKDLVEDIKK